MEVKNSPNEKEPKERILEAAASLFATKGYAAVGVREIAELANVNVAMISYYFSGKSGILKEIILKYFDDVKSIFDKILSERPDPQEAVKNMVEELVSLMKNKTIFCKVAITEMPFNLPEFADFKAEVAKRHIEYVKQSFQLIELFFRDEKILSIVGPAAISLIFSHFLFSPFVKKVWNVELDDEYYKLYSETISTLLLDGINGLKNKFNNNTGDKQ